MLEYNHSKKYNYIFAWINDFKRLQFGTITLTASVLEE